MAALQVTGYDTAVTELFGTVHSRADRYVWTRVRVGGGESMADFIHNLGPEESSLVLATVTTETPRRTGHSGQQLIISPWSRHGCSECGWTASTWTRPLHA